MPVELIAMLYQRIANSTVVWAWFLNGLRLGSGLIVLPLVLHLFSKSELGLYMVLLKLAGLAAMIDFGFGPTVNRFVCYAMGGAKEIEAQGAPTSAAGEGPNYTLLWQLLATTRKLYRYLSLVLLIVLGIGGTLMVERLIRGEQALHPEFGLLLPRLAWAATLLATVLDIYSNWWGNYLRGLNEVRAATKVAAAAAIARLGIAAGLLISGAGLLSLPIATMASSLIQRHYARICCLKLLPPQPRLLDLDLRKNLRMLWPNSWRLGVHLFSSYAVALASTLICAGVYHLEVSAMYETSVQLIGYASSMAAVWTLTKWPLIGQLQARRDQAAIQRVIGPRIWLQNLTFLILAGGVVLFAPAVLDWVGKDKELLPRYWMLCLTFGAFLELQVSTFGTLIATGNRLPFLWPAVATNLFSITVSLLLLRWTSWGPGALILGPLLAGSAFNYWYWPRYAARMLGTSLTRLLFLNPVRQLDGIMGEKRAD
jgi:Na+-driven multidrug efflux pump